MPVTTTTKAAGIFGAHRFMAAKATMAHPPTANEATLVWGKASPRLASNVGSRLLRSLVTPSKCGS